MKYIFFTGGVVSSLGKGIATAAVGHLLEERGLRITLQKFDPYINVDPGTMDPYQHGEVYVTDDGAETDLDLGHYERFTNVSLTKDHNITTGKIYEAVITRERRGEYLGQTVQVIPHITDEIKSSILKIADPSSVDVVLAEIGGTVGDIESLPFLEAIRQFRNDVGKENVIHIHLTLIPFIGVSGELKTKPTQHSVMKLREIGIQPDIILCRTNKPLSRELKEKISLFCDVSFDCIIDAYDVEFVYEVPLIFKNQGLDEIIIRLLGLSEILKEREPKEDRWSEVIKRLKNPRSTVEIAVVGKYITLRDAYKSIIEALIHGGIANWTRVNIRWVDSESLKNQVDAERHLSDVDGILVPGGFGYRGVEGKIEAVRYAREHKIPFFGICLGLQCTVIEIANNVACLFGANTSECSSHTLHPVIDLLPEQKNIKDKGGTMRLGLFKVSLEKDSLAYRAYQKEEVSERHRHRYEVNNAYRDTLINAGLRFTGIFKDKDLVEIVELEDHPWFLATQFHPEFKSTPTDPHPLFRDFIKASLERKTQGLKIVSCNVYSHR